MNTARTIPLIPTPAHLEDRDGWSVGADPLGALTCQVSRELEHGEFEIEVSEDAIAARAGSNEAALNARLTLEQLSELCREGKKVRIPALILRDQPRFSWRGLHIDPCRHFLPMEELRRIVEVMSLYRLNILHLHLTDDQGWRIEIDGYPRLTEVAAWRERTVIGHHNVKDPSADQYLEEHHGGYYTQAELRDLVAFARERGITVVPEIDLPGHMQAAIAAYPEFGAWPKVQHKVRGTQRAAGTTSSSRPRPRSTSTSRSPRTARASPSRHAGAGTCRPSRTCTRTSYFPKGFRRKNPPTSWASRRKCGQSSSRTPSTFSTCSSLAFSPSPSATGTTTHQPSRTSLSACRHTSRSSSARGCVTAPSADRRLSGQLVNFP